MAHKKVDKKESKKNDSLEINKKVAILSAHSKQKKKVGSITIRGIYL